jgi:exopolyphosphatase / guanosine-5'-triphosphate,3'-diphosphate pyrophosphatase
VTRVAAIDLGTNATRLLVADVDGEEMTELVRRTRITRLGEGVDARRRLLPVAIARVRNALTDFRREAEALGAERTLAVATSSVRDAENGEAFLGEVEWSYGFATRLLTGDEEAGMTLRGVGPLAPGTVVVDVGGGSTELITDGFRTSLDIGCVRLTERHGGDLEAMAAGVRAALPPLRADRVLNVDGTTAELSALAGDTTVRLAAIDAALAWLTAASDAERRARLVEPDRSDVLAAGVVIVRETLHHLGLDRTTASERDLLNGVALAAAELPEPEEGAAPPGAYTCC